MRATKVNAGLAESNGKLLLGIWRDSLHVICALTACTPGSAPGPTLGNEYGKTLHLTFIITRVSNALNTLVSGEKPGFQALSKGLVVLLCAEVVRQGVPDHGAVHSECSASNSG